VARFPIRVSVERRPRPGDGPAALGREIQGLLAESPNRLPAAVRSSARFLGNLVGQGLLPLRVVQGVAIAWAERAGVSALEVLALIDEGAAEIHRPLAVRISSPRGILPCRRTV
jgi:hypothetical protein